MNTLTTVTPGSGSPPPTASLTAMAGKSALVDALFQKRLGRAPAQQAAFAGQGAITTDMVADWSYMTRTASDVGNSTCEVSGTHSPLFDSSLNNPAGGITTAGNMVTGLIAASNAYGRLETTGRLEAKVDVARGLMQSAAGAVYGVFRGVSMASVIKNVDTSSASAPTLLGRATYVIGFIGLVLFGVFYLILAAGAAINLRAQYKLKQRLDKAADPIQFLRDKLTVTKDTVLRKLDKQGLDVQKTLREEALNAGEEELKALCQELKIDMPTDPRAFLENLMSPDELEQMGTELMIVKLQKKREVKLAVLVGGDTMRQVKAGTATDASVRAALKTSIAYNWGLLITCVVGFIVTVLSMVFLGGLPALIVNSIFLGVTVSMLFLDGYYYVKQLQSDAPPGKHDEKMLVSQMVIYGVVFALGVVFTLTYGLPLLPLIFLGVIVGGTYLIDGLMLHHIAKNKHKHLRKHPTPEFYLEALQHQDVECKEIFERLPQDVKKEFTAEDTAEDVAEAIQTYFEKRKLLKEEHQQLLIQSIQQISNI